jgi:hypothetical protein
MRGKAGLRAGIGIQEEEVLRVMKRREIKAETQANGVPAAMGKVKIRGEPEIRPGTQVEEVVAMTGRSRAGAERDKLRKYQWICKDVLL